MVNSADPTDLDLHLQNRIYLVSAGQGLNLFKFSYENGQLMKRKILEFELAIYNPVNTVKSC